MKCIFTETVVVGTAHTIRVGRGYSMRVIRNQDRVHARTVAQYSQKHSVLVVDCDVTTAGNWHHDPQRTLESVGTAAEAIRRAVQLADAWRAIVAEALPPPDNRPDDLVIAEAERTGAVIEEWD